MKTFKNKRLKATLLAIAAVLTFGLTSCTDEIGSDVTTGEPGYLTLNLKTLQTKQTKLTGDSVNDFKKITNLNIFVFQSGGELLLNKYIDATSGVSSFNSAGNPISIPIQVSTLPTGAFVVVVANYYGEAGSEDANGKRIDDIENYAQLEAKVIPTIKDFSTTGLHMTGRGDINYTNAASYIYTATVKIAPVEAKITVKWTFEALSDADNYDVTGIYVVNAISQTTMPIILNTTTAAVTGNIVPTPATKNISLIPATPATRTALTGLAAVASRDFNFYTMTIQKDLLSDTINMGTNTTLASGFTSMEKPFHYYVGENLSNNEIMPQASQGAILADNTTKSQNTLVVLRVNPKHDAPLYIRNMGARYYTYEFNKTSTGATTGQNTENLGSATDGFSVRRKTNYTLTFNLKEIGAPEPFRRVSTLTVDVQANTWDDATSSQTF